MNDPIPFDRNRVPPPNKGRLIDAEEVASEILRGKRSARWVRDNVPGRVELGPRTVLWFEDDVWRWLRDEGAA